MAVESNEFVRKCFRSRVFVNRTSSKVRQTKNDKLPAPLHQPAPIRGTDSNTVTGSITVTGTIDEGDGDKGDN